MTKQPSFLREVGTAHLTCHIRSDNSVQNIFWACDLSCGHRAMRRAKLKNAHHLSLPKWEDFEKPPAKLKCHNCRWNAKNEPDLYTLLNAEAVTYGVHATKAS